MKLFYAFYEEPFFINCKNLFHLWHAVSNSILFQDLSSLNAPALTETRVDVQEGVFNPK